MGVKQLEIEAMLRQIFLEKEVLSRYLTVYHMEPAVFINTSPADKSLYERNEIFPHITLSLSKNEEQKRKNNGSLCVRVFHRIDENCSDEITNEIKNSLNLLFLKPVSIPESFRWYKTKERVLTNYNSTEMYLKETASYYDRIKFPMQETADPDPIQALYRYLKLLFPELVFLGMDDFGLAQTASDQNCMVYCALDSLVRGDETYTLTWMTGKASIHVIHSSMDERRKVLTAIMYHLSGGDEINTLDGTPMLITALDVHYKADMLTEGQIKADFKYGLPRYRAKSHILTNAQISYTE